MLTKLAAGIALAALAGSPAPLGEEQGAASRTDNRALEGFLSAVAPGFAGQPGHWTFRKDDVEVSVVSDEVHDRMRVLAWVGNTKKLSAAELSTLLDANFDRALDAKYATRQGAVWAVYMHPLSSLTREEFESAVRQVVLLKQNYGTTYASTRLVFTPAR